MFTSQLSIRETAARFDSLQASSRQTTEIWQNIALVFFNGKESAKSNRSQSNFADFAVWYNCIVLEAFGILKTCFPGSTHQNLVFKTNRDKKYCLSSEIKVSQVEKCWKAIMISICNLHNMGIPHVDVHHFFNLWDLYLRAQTIFFITVCFKTQVLPNNYRLSYSVCFWGPSGRSDTWFCSVAPPPQGKSQIYALIWWHCLGSILWTLKYWSREFDL